MAGVPLPPTATLIEVGPRDGWQAEATRIPTAEKVRAIDALSASGLQAIQVTAFVHPRAVPQLADAEDVCARITRRPGVEYSGLALNLRGVERAAAAGVHKVDVSLSASETHSRRNANRGVDDALGELRAMVSLARSRGLRVRAGVQCAFGCAYEGPIAPDRVIALLTALAALEVDELSLADSTGMADPAAIEKMLALALPIAQGAPFTLHLHDTRGNGLANVLAALRRGVTRFDTAFGGMGGCPFIPGATGNIATEATATRLDAMGVATGIDVAAVAAVWGRMAAILGRSPSGEANETVIAMHAADRYPPAL